MSVTTYSSKYSGAEQDAFFDKLQPLGISPLAQVAISNSYNDLSNKPPNLTTSSITIDLNSQTWTESSNGLFYTGNISVPNLEELYAVTITEFSALKTTDNVIPITNASKNAVRLTASVNTFSNQSSITVSVFGRYTQS